MIESINKQTGEITTFNTKYSFARVPGESYKNVESMTDATQYVPTKTLIKSIVRGNVDRLAQMIANMPSDDFEDPTMAPGYDLADAFEDMQQAKEDLEAEKKASESDQVKSSTPIADTPPEATTNENKG